MGRGGAGEDCSISTCPNHCSHHGECVDGKCFCRAGFSGKDCSVRSCPADCSGNGRCMDDFSCACADGWTGFDCSLKSCSTECTGNGYCYNGTCFCKPGFTGIHCTLPSCPSACSYDWTNDGFLGIKDSSGNSGHRTQQLSLDSSDGRDKIVFLSSEPSEADGGRGLLHNGHHHHHERDLTDWRHCGYYFTWQSSLTC